MNFLSSSDIVFHASLGYIQILFLDINLTGKLKPKTQLDHRNFNILFE
jgi:hypothetical protein